MNDDGKLDEEILASFERDEWRAVADADEEIGRYAGYARATLAKDKRVNIRISSRDLEELHARAAAEGMPYQTLMSSVLHKYVTGRLVEPPARPAPRSGERRGVKRRAE